MSDSADFRNGDFTLLMKRTREKFGVSIDGAYDMILAEDEMRRLIAWRINHDLQCIKLARAEIRRNGRRKSRFVIEGDRIRIRDFEELPPRY